MDTLLPIGTKILTISNYGSYHFIITGYSKTKRFYRLNSAKTRIRSVKDINRGYDNSRSVSYRIMQ